jgi:hypothetical protein
MGVTTAVQPACSSVTLEETHVRGSRGQRRAVGDRGVAKCSADGVSHVLDDVEHGQDRGSWYAESTKSDIRHRVDDAVKAAFGVVGANGHGFTAKLRVVTDQSGVEAGFISPVASSASCLFRCNTIVSFSFPHSFPA